MFSFCGGDGGGGGGVCAWMDVCISGGWLGGLLLTVNDTLLHAHTQTLLCILHSSLLSPLPAPLLSSSHAAEELKCKCLRVKPRRPQTETINPLVFPWPCS